MPHYRDGQPAKVGDVVRGTTYNRGGRVLVGTVIRITPGSESYNCIVAFADVRKLELGEGEQYFSDKWRGLFKREPAFVGDGHGGGKPHELTFVESDWDYGELKALDLVHRPE